MPVKTPEKRDEKKQNTCFVIMPFSDPEGYEPGHFRNVYEHTFAPAIREAGYEPLRIDDNIVSSLIHGKMMNELVTAPMVLCDLSTNNPNVLYELGIRHAFDLPVVLVQESGQDRIFDIAGITSVEYHRSRLYEEVIQDQKLITKAIRQTANAKDKYSIMKLVNLHAASLADPGSVTREDRLEYLIQDMTRKMNMLEKRFLDFQPKMVDARFPDRRIHAAEELVASLTDLMDQAEDYLDRYEMDSTNADRVETEYLMEELRRKSHECRDAAVSPGLVRHAEVICGRLKELLTNQRVNHMLELMKKHRSDNSPA